MRVHITRRGGLAGVQLSADLDTESFGKKTAAELDRALEQLMARDGERTAPPHPDAFEYEIVLPEHNQSARVGESELPPELRPLVRELVSRGEFGSPRSPQ
jgi:hypothetical protein